METVQSRDRPPRRSSLSLSLFFSATPRGQRATNCSFSRIQRAPGGSKASVVVFHSGKCPPHATSIYSTPPLAFSGWKLLWIFVSFFSSSSSSSSSSSFFGRRRGKEGSERSLEIRRLRQRGEQRGERRSSRRKRVIMLMNADLITFLRELQSISSGYLSRGAIDKEFCQLGNESSS